MHIILLKSDKDREKDMKNRKIFKAVSIVLCFLLISVSFTACQAVRNKFYKGAKKHLEDKYDVKCDSLIYYEQPDINNTELEFGIVELDNGERIIVSLAEGNYADSYELLELYDAWMKEISLELEADVVIADVTSNGLAQDPNFGKFIETSKKRYNASNVDEFINDFYDYTYNEEIDFIIVKKDPTMEWMEDLADKMEAYRRKVGAKKISADVIDKPLLKELPLYPDDYIYHGKTNCYGWEYSILYDGLNRYNHIDPHKFRDKTICISLRYKD